MKVDLYNNEKRWKNWREEFKDRDIEEISKKNSDLIKEYLFDMEKGENIASSNKKGGRSFSRLNNLQNRMVYLTKLFEREFNNIELVKLKSSQVMDIFSRMRRGDIKKKGGLQFKSVADYVKCFKAFWHWWMKFNSRKKKPVHLEDITEDIDTSYDNKPKWVFLDEKQMEKLMENCNNYYKPLILFLYDTGSRLTEGFSVLVEDVTQDKKGQVYVQLRDENSKTFGRKIKLMLSGKQILEYIKENKLQPQDRLFSHSAKMTNKYLGELAKKLFGDGNSEGGEKFSNMTLYDLRHISCCFWLDRYKRSSDLMFKFGWATERYIHYYSEFRGKRDKISDEDMYVDITKTELEKDVKKLKFENKKIKGQVVVMAEQNKQLGEQVKVVSEMLKKIKSGENY